MTDIEMLSFVVKALWGLLGLVVAVMLKQTHLNQRELFERIRNTEDRLTRIEVKYEIARGG